MSIKSYSAKIFASKIRKKIDKWANNPHDTQHRVFNNLINNAKNTRFGKDHHFENIRSHKDFVKHVPVRDYEELKEYVDLMVKGEKDVLWPGKPLYYAKTSGTTSGAKYIPLTKESMPTHINAARNAILCYIEDTGKAKFVDGKMIFLQGSPELSEKNGVKLGRLSGIVAHYVPAYLQKNRMPSWETNRIEDWETKVDAIVDETVKEDMSVISGIPSWVQMYFEKLIEKTGNKVGEIFPNFDLFIYGGVNYEPYRSKFESLIGRKVDSIELYPGRRAGCPGRRAGWRPSPRGTRKSGSTSGIGKVPHTAEEQRARDVLRPLVDGARQRYDPGSPAMGVKEQYDGSAATGRAIAHLYPAVVHIVTRQDEGDPRGLGSRRQARLPRARRRPARRSTPRPSSRLTASWSTIWRRAISMGLAADLLQSGEIDAFFVVGGLPVEAVEDLARRICVRLLQIEDAPRRRHHELLAVPGGCGNSSGI